MCIRSKSQKKELPEEFETILYTTASEILFYREVVSNCDI